MSGHDDDTRLDLPVQEPSDDTRPLPAPMRVPVPGWSGGISGSALAGISKRYSQDQDRDDKSGYRLTCRPVALVEGMVLDQVKASGSVLFTVAMQHAVRVGVPEREASHAILRLIVRGELAYDLAAGVLTKGKPVGYWRRIWRAFWGHPACLVVVGAGITAPSCALWAFLCSISA